MQKVAQSSAATQHESDTRSSQPRGVAAPSARATHPLFDLQRSIGNKAVSRLLNPGAGDSPPPERGNTRSIGPANHPTEREADCVAGEVVPVTRPNVRTALIHIGGAVGSATAAPASVERELAGSGTPLDPVVRRTMEARFGHDFSSVRVHTGSTAAQSADDVRAHAYTSGHHIVFGRNRFAPQTAAGRRLLAHELTHVVQQNGSTRVVARQPAGDADANVSLGLLDNSFVGRAGESVLGHTQWLVLREFLRGLAAGLQAVPPEQRKRIDEKAKDFGVTNALKYVGGYALGILAGLWTSITGLVEAVITLITLPYEISKFLAEKVPQLAARYGPRIAQLLTEGGGLPERIRTIALNFTKNPSKSIRQISAFLDAVGTLALGQVRALGRGAANKVLAFLEEPWFDYGFDTGKVVGQILFEVILAVASDAIANVVKEALAVVARVSARVVTGAVELVRSAGRFLGEAVEWVASMGRRAGGELGEMFESVRAFLNKLKALIGELGEETALADTGAGTVRVPTAEAKAGVLESRAVQPPARTSPATVADLTPPKVHPSNVAKDLPAPKKVAPGKAPFDEPLTASERNLTPEQLRQKHILENQAAKQNEFRSAAKSDLTSGEGPAKLSTREVWEPPPGSPRKPPPSAPLSRRREWLRRRLQLHTDQAVERFETEGLTLRQGEDVARYEAHRGSRIDQFAKESVMQDPELAELISAPDFVAEPDILDSVLPDWFDITTRQSWVAHLVRYRERYGTAAHLLTTR